MLEWGVDGIQTDHVDELIELLRTRTATAVEMEKENRS